MVGKFASAALLMVATAVPAQAATIVFEGGVGGVPAGSTLIEDFTTATDGPGYSIYTTNVPTQGARPAFTTGDAPYLAVKAGGSYTINFAPSALASFNLGSLDMLNTLTVLFADNSTLKLDGGQIIGGATAALPNSGHQGLASTNGLVNIFSDSGPAITGLLFESGVNAFEVDQISTAAVVPEPATWLTMLGGFGALAMVARRRRKMRVGDLHSA